jgi:hypothetical protein
MRWDLFPMLANLNGIHYYADLNLIKLPFLQEYSNILLSKEFIVKIDAASSTPYLIVRLSDMSFQLSET